MAGEGAPRLMSFVTEKELEDVKQKRQEEWEKVRKPSDPVERPEEVYDPRPLYERLKEQRDKKQEQWDEQFKFKNMIYQGLDEDEAVFLKRIADQKAAHNAEVAMIETEELSEFRQAVAELADTDNKILTPTTPVPSNTGASSAAPGSAEKKTKKSSLASLIGGSIRRKRTSSEDTDQKHSPVRTEDKKPKLSASEESSDGPSDKTCVEQVTKTLDQPIVQSASRLPGLSLYSDSSGESSDNDE